ncbi:MAG: ABC transporter substrate-binding protein [Deltaproteobacteria bacterium]|jgi:iron complex transport system substrate-binding protein|nr:ABC transporter substrate-binding protein [Deltaproteobacteria bacterium]
MIIRKISSIGLTKLIFGPVFFFLVFLGLGLVKLSAAETRTVLDSYGRPVTIPKVVTKVAPFIPAFCQVTEMLTRGGGRVVAYPTAGISEYFKKVFPDIVRSNPKPYDSRAVEDVVASGAEVAYGPELALSDTQKEQLRQAGVAVVAANGIATVAELSQSFLIIGNILGETEAQRAREFVAYYQGNVDLAARKTAIVPPNQRVKVLVLYGGAGGYRTINKNDISHHYLSAAGGVNLAADYMLGGQNMGGVIDFETIVSFKPEVIFSAGPTDRLEILKEPALAEVPAVKNGRVYACPKGIFVWYARSAEGAMLPLWFGTKLYPELFQDINMATVVRNYFANFYDYQIPDEELRVVLNIESHDPLGPGQ